MTVHVVRVFLWNGDVHDRLVDVLRIPTVIAKLAAGLPRWKLSPRYVAVIVCVPSVPEAGV
jgi:hypothetical protein